MCAVKSMERTGVYRHCAARLGSFKWRQWPLVVNLTARECWQAAHAAAERKRAEARAEAAHKRAEMLAAQRRAQAEVRARQIKQVEQVSSIVTTSVTSRKHVCIALCLMSLCVLRLRLLEGPCLINEVRMETCTCSWLCGGVRSASTSCIEQPAIVTAQLFKEPPHQLSLVASEACTAWFMTAFMVMGC